MRLYTFEVEGQPRLGAEHKGQLVDLNAAAQAAPRGGSSLPADMLSLIKAGSTALDAARQALAFAAQQSSESTIYAFDQVHILAPIPRPGKILCSGMNYRSHVEENPNAKFPDEPFFFAKLPSGVIGPGDPIIHPKGTRQMDYEVEFAVVIGQSMRNVAETDTMSHIFGYTILHDVSARDVQFKDNQITLGKNFDTFAPMGPCIVTADELPDPRQLRLRTWLNGQVMQDRTNEDWLFPLPTLLASLTRVMTLEPGDVVSTGTPAGVGVFRQPPVFLQPGDVVVLEIEGIGRLENPVVAEA